MFTKIDNSPILQHLFPGIPQADSAETGFGTEIFFQIDNEVSLCCNYLEASASSPTILYFPSRQETSSTFAASAAEYQNHGINVFYVCYRGFGKSTGAPTTSTLLQDAHALLKLIKKSQKDNSNTGELFVMGQEIGSVFAIDLALNHKDLIKGLIIESGICTTIQYLTQIGVVAPESFISEEEGFNNISKIEKIEMPTLIFHGSRNQYTTTAEAELLQSYSGARSKQFFIIPGAEHNNLAQTGGALYFQTIKKHMDTVCGVNTWRQRRQKTKPTT